MSVGEGGEGIAGKRSSGWHPTSEFRLRWSACSQSRILRRC